MLPEKDKFGRTILFFKPGNVKPVGKTIAQDIFTCIAILMEALTEDEENQIKGFVYIFDVSGLGLGHLGILPIEEWIRVGKNGEKGLAARHKGFHAVNVPPVLSFLTNVIMKAMPEKLQKRVNFYKNFDDLDFIDKKHLPKEYGGQLPMAELSSTFDLTFPV